MFRLLTALLALLLIYSAGHPYTVNEELYVFAKSGINLRTKPALGPSGIIVTVPYGEKVRVVKTGGTEDSVTIENIKGRWVSVAYKNTNGYLFDGFLLKLPAPKKLNDVYQYISNDIGVISNLTRGNDEDLMTFYCRQGVVLAAADRYGVRKAILTIPGISQEGAFVLSRILFYDWLSNVVMPVSGYTNYVTNRIGKDNMTVDCYTCEISNNTIKLIIAKDYFNFIMEIYKSGENTVINQRTIEMMGD